MNNGIEKITGRIIDEAETQARKNIDEANTRAAEILQGYEKEAEKITEKYRAEGEKEYAAILEREKSGAELRDRSAVLLAKASLIDKAFELALERIRSFDADKYYSFLENRLKEVISSAQREKEAHASSGDEYESYDTYILTMNSSDREKFGERLVKSAAPENEKLLLDEKTADIAGGFILKYASIETNCSLEITMSRARDTMEKDVCKILFG